MAFIEIVSPSQATGETADVYRYMNEVGGGQSGAAGTASTAGNAGMIAKIVQMFSLRAGSMRRMIRTWELIMWSGDASRQDRELVAATVSRFNNCHY